MWFRALFSLEFVAWHFGFLPSLLFPFVDAFVYRFRCAVPLSQSHVRTVSLGFVSPCLPATKVMLPPMFNAREKKHPFQAPVYHPSNLCISILISIHFLLLNSNLLLLSQTSLTSVIRNLLLIFFSFFLVIIITSSLLALVGFSLALYGSELLDTSLLSRGGGDRSRGSRSRRQFLDLVFDGAEGGRFA